MSVDKESGAFLHLTSKVIGDMKEITENLNRVLEQVESATLEGLMRFGRAILERSNFYVPKDTGTLEKSGFVSMTGGERPSVSAGASPAVTVGYDGNGEAPYAVFVHELLHLQHKPPTQAKFLQQAMEEIRNEAERLVQEEIRKQIGSTR